jgi:hypothetical protein
MQRSAQVLSLVLSCVAVTGCTLSGVSASLTLLRLGFMQESGLKRDCLFVYDLELPADFEPQPGVGSVLSVKVCYMKSCMD